MGSQAVGHDLAAEQQPLQQRFGRKNITEVPLTAGIIELQLTLQIFWLLSQLKIHNLSHT